MAKPQAAAAESGPLMDVEPPVKKLEVYSENVLHYSCPKCKMQVAMIFQNMHVCEAISTPEDQTTQKAV